MRIACIVLAVLSVSVLLAAGAAGQEVETPDISKGQLLPAPTIARSPLALERARTGMDTTSLFTEDFESGGTSWTTSGSWDIGAPASGPYSGHNSTSCAATDLNGQYANSADDWLIGPSIYLPPLANQIDSYWLFLWEWFHIESYYDAGTVMISTNGGTSWNQLSTRAGSSDWRREEIQLTAYAGETIQLAFVLTSDCSVTYDGWYIDDIEVALLESAPLSITCISLNHQNFPFVYIHVTVDTFGIGHSGLNQSDFRVYEDDAPQWDYFEVVPPDTSGGVRLADIVFLMDNSGSMGGEINAISNNVMDFVDGLAAAGVDFSLGLCRFGASENYGYPIIEDSGILTSDAHYFKYDVWDRNVTSGGFEPGWDALCEAAHSFSFRPGALRVFMLLTDETPSGNNNVGNYSQAEAIACVQTNGISTFCFVDLSDPYAVADYCVIAEQANGTCFDIMEPMDEVLSYISEHITNTYVIRYKSDDPLPDGIERCVRAEVTYDGETRGCVLCYTPGSAPSIVRTPTTIALHDQAWAEGTTTTIAVEIVNYGGVGIQDATLHYRTTGAAGYTSVAMTDVGGDIYEGIVPGANVGTPGLDYWMSASDGTSTASDPPVDPSLYPYQLAILPNVAPLINHTPVVSIVPGTSVAIGAEIEDATNELAYAEVKYRKTGNLIYQSVTMSNPFGDMYDATVPASYVTNDGLDYYIRAVDDLGVASTEGTFLSPIQAYPLCSYGFTRDPDAWRFNNTSDQLWPAGSGNWPPAYLFKEAFDTGSLMSPSEWLYYQFLLRIVYKKNWGGSCYGMAYTSQLIKDGLHLLDDMSWTTQDNLWSIMNTNAGCRDYINKYHLYQWGALQLALQMSYNLAGYEANAGLVRSALCSGNSAAVTIRYTKSNGKTVGHAVTPLSIEKTAEEPKTYRIMTYDNSYNGQDYELIVDVTNKSWTYNTPASTANDVGFSVGVPTVLQLIPPVIPTGVGTVVQSALDLPDSLMPRIRVSDPAFLSVSQEKDILIRAAAGSLGYRNGAVVDAFTNGTCLYPFMDGAEFDKPPMYGYVRDEVDCTIYSDTDDDYEFYLFQDGMALNLRKPACTPDDRDRVVVLCDTRSSIGYRYWTSGDEPQRLDAELVKVTAEAERSFGLLGIRGASSDTLTVRILGESRDSQDYIMVRNSGREQIVTVEVDLFEDEAVTHFLARSVRVDSMSVCYFHPVWDSLDMSLLQMIIDTDMDGAPDDTLFLRNQYSPETGGILNNDSIYFYPNPFDPAGHAMGLVRYSLSEPGRVTIKIYDVAGELVTTLRDSEQQEALVEQGAEWDARNDEGRLVANGVYFCVVESSSGEKGITKIAVLK